MAFVLALLPGLACGLADAPEPAAAGRAEFTVRSRQDDPGRLRFRIDVTGTPVEAEVFRTAVRRAFARWSELDGIAFSEATDGVAPDVEVAWRTGAHDRCTPFGFDTGVAHTGPARAPAYVHFDAERPWSLAGGGGALSLVDNALHEIGHVLGLDHSPDIRALMHPDPARTGSDLGISDFAGIHSLYGGGTDAPADLEILHMPRLGQTSERATFPLRRVAPEETTAFALFDIDGDGAEEVVVWRTDRAGHGALIAYHFDLGPRLERTTGPLFGSVGTGTRVLLRLGPEGTRLLIQVLPGGRVDVRGFDDGGRLHALAAYPLALDDLVDADADGVLDEPYVAPEATDARTGDVDGDGMLEVVRRHGSAP